MSIFIRTNETLLRFELLNERRFLRSIQRSGAGDTTVPPSHSVLRPSNMGKSLSLFSFPSGILYIITNAQEVSKQHLMTYRVTVQSLAGRGPVFCRSHHFLLKSFVAETRRSTRAR